MTLLSATEDSKKEDTTNELINEDVLKWGGFITGGLALAGILAMAGMGWMKEQDQEKKRAELLKQQQMRQQLALEMQQRQRQQEQQDQQSWPNTIPRNTIQQRPPSPVMELPSDIPDDTDDHFVGNSNSPTTAYNTNEQQRFVVSDDIVNTHRYPVIDPHAPTQQIGNKISRVMNLDDYPNQRQQSQYQQQNSSPPPPIRTNNNSVGDDEDISDIFNS